VIPKVSRRPTVVELLDRAESFRAILDRDGVNQAELARRFGITRARVTQLLNLLALAPDVRAEVRRLVGAGVKVSERALRPLVGKPVRTQQAAVGRLAGGSR
jgi:ParB-like chromosome segregation protein Spo0J